jgi:hypothetical protein
LSTSCSCSKNPTVTGQPHKKSPAPSGTGDSVFDDFSGMQVNTSGECSRRGNGSKRDSVGYDRNRGYHRVRIGAVIPAVYARQLWSLRKGRRR